LARHLFLCRGAKVCICNNEIILLTEPAVERCPFVESFYGVSEIDEEAVRRIVRYKVDHFGFCLIFSTCNTVVGENEVKFLKEADIVCASASQTVREKIGPKALIQLGVTIPVFVLTDIGKRLVLAYIQECEEPLLISRVKMPFILEDKQPVSRRKREE